MINYRSIFQLDLYSLFTGTLDSFISQAQSNYTTNLTFCNLSNLSSVKKLVLIRELNLLWNLQFTIGGKQWETEGLHNGIT